MPTYEERIAQREMLQRKAIADATAVGFRDCHAVFDALGFDRVNAGGMTRSSLQVASRWIVPMLALRFGDPSYRMADTAAYPKRSGRAATWTTYQI